MSEEQAPTSTDLRAQRTPRDAKEIDIVANGLEVNWHVPGRSLLNMRNMLT